MAEEEKVVAAVAEEKAEKPAKAASTKAVDKTESALAAVVADKPATDTNTADAKAEASSQTSAQPATERPVRTERPAPSGTGYTPRSDRPSGGDRPYRNNNSGGPRQRRKKVCQFCIDRQESIDYKDTGRMRKFISERAKIIPRRVTGTCAYHQRELTLAIKKARQIALLPYVND